MSTRNGTPWLINQGAGAPNSCDNMLLQWYPMVPPIKETVWGVFIRGWHSVEPSSPAIMAWYMKLSSVRSLDKRWVHHEGRMGPPVELAFRNALQVAEIYGLW